VPDQSLAMNSFDLASLAVENRRWGQRSDVKALADQGVKHQGVQLSIFLLSQGRYLGMIGAQDARKKVILDSKRLAERAGPVHNDKRAGCEL